MSDPIAALPLMGVKQMHRLKEERKQTTTAEQVLKPLTNFL